MEITVAIIGRRNAHLLDRIAPGVFDAGIDGRFVPDLLADPAQRLFVATLELQVVGQLKAVLHRHPEKPPGLFVEEIGVSDGFRRRGIGTALMQAALAHGRDHGCRELWLATEPENDAANAFYRAIGLSGQHVVMYSREM